MKIYLISIRKIKNVNGKILISKINQGNITIIRPPYYGDNMPKQTTFYKMVEQSGYW